MFRTLLSAMRSGPGWRRGGVFAGLFAVVGAAVVAGSHYAAAPADGMKVAAGLQHPFGGEFDTWTRGKFLAVGLRALDDSACEDLAGSYVGQTRARQGMVGAMVSQTAGTMTPPAVAADGTITGGFQAPYTISRAGAACRFGEGANDLFLVFDAS